MSKQVKHIGLNRGFSTHGIHIQTPTSESTGRKKSENSLQGITRNHPRITNYVNHNVYNSNNLNMITM